MRGMNKERYLLSRIERLEKMLTSVHAPVGMIVMWGGELDKIPKGWQLCDGSNGTPDLRDRFVVSQGPNYIVGDVGGTIDHAHADHPAQTISGTIGTQSVTRTSLDTTVARDNHTHSLPAMSHTDADTGNVRTDHRPPYYALAFIQKMV